MVKFIRFEVRSRVSRFLSDFALSVPYLTTQETRCLAKLRLLGLFDLKDAQILHKICIRLMIKVEELEDILQNGKNLTMTSLKTTRGHSSELKKLCINN